MAFPRSLFSDETRPNPKNFINYSSTFKTVKAVKDVVSAEVWEYVENSPLGVIIKYVNLEFAWSSKLAHYILSRQLFCKKKHELWVVEDVEKSNRFWGLFKLKHPRSTPSSEDVLALCQSPEVCKYWSWEDQIRLCYLAILTGGLLGLDRREAIPPAKAKLLMDLEIFEQYPWGRVAFVELVNQIKTKTESGDIKQSCYVCKAFVQVIQIWAYAYIPCLGEAIGRPIRSNGLCLLRFKGENGKLPLGNILQNAKVTCMCPRSMNEVHPVWEHQDEDPEIDNLLEFLRQEIPEYHYLEGLAGNVGDGGENSGDISENEDQVESDDDEGKYFIQRRQTPERLFSMERPDVGTLQNLTSRIATLEQMDLFVHLVKRVILLEENTRIPNHSLEPTKKKVTDVREPKIGEDCNTRKSQRLSNKPIRKSARVAELSEKSNTNNLVVYGLVDKEKVKALNAFVKTKGDSTYPPGDVLMAKDFFKRFHKPRGWLSFTEFDVPLALYRLRFSKNPSDFIYPRIAIMDAVFPMWCSSRYKEWLRDQSKIPTGAYDYYIGKRPTISPTGKQWGRDVDTLYSVLMVDNCHWVLMETIKEAAIPFAHMIPSVLYTFADAEVKQVMDTAMYSIQFVTDGVPQSKPPHGNCGIYAVKFLECLVMGVPFADEHLRDSNMSIMRRKLATEMYDETRQVFEDMR
ncbi:hypothetical protein Bca52824_011541 [Brassica carinata]|uniref:Ubiquitin-like protease family profile domain-containing protein n=1 Tax=Brassica carinata TaxID=52824 RepID=A0A8X7WIB8_BRACI|nr:hypothetical protein Bca52824_011541 [Brassica carinata]